MSVEPYDDVVTESVKRFQVRITRPRVSGTVNPPRHPHRSALNVPVQKRIKQLEALARRLTI